MRDDNGDHSVVWRKANGRLSRRQLAPAVLVLVLASCSSSQPELQSAVGPQATRQGFLGAVVADDPRAAYVGRDILFAGGNAVDAVVATYFAMAVTSPSTASLGGGGVCVVGDPASKEVKAVEFTARAPALGGATERPTAVPGNVRGFFALQARYGQLRWSQLIAPAEGLAAFGTPVSRGYAEDMRSLNDALLAEPSFRQIFLAPDGSRLLTEEQPLIQPELASVLSVIRTEGGNAFYRGPLAEKLVAAARLAGGDLTTADLAGYQVRITPTIHVPAGGDATAHFPPAPISGGVMAAQMWSVLYDRDRYEDANSVGKGVLLARASRETLADRPRWTGIPASDSETQIPVSSAVIKRLAADSVGPGASSTVAPVENPSAGLIVAVDRRGQTVACAVTLNSLFGTGRIAGGTGILLAAVPGSGGRGFAMLGPVVMVNDYAREFFFAGASAGGIAGPTALIKVAADARIEERPLAEAITAKRFVGTPDGRAYVEDGITPDITTALQGQGQQVTIVRSLGRVNAINCTSSIPDDPETCAAVADPRGAGLAAIAE